MNRNEYLEKKLNEPNQYSKGYVAFLDLLGFSNLCLNEPCEKIKAIINDINLLKYNYIYSFSSLIIPPKVIDNTVIRLVSDSIIIVTPNNDYGLLFILYFCALLHIKLLDCGILLRGGIEKGEYFVDEKTIFGPSVIKAYHLENQQAIYPRIIISNDIVKDLKDRGFQKKRTVEDYIKERNEHDDLFIQFKLLCIKYSDDRYFVHYFNSVQNIALSKSISHKERIDSFISDSILAYKGTKYYQKYKWLFNYYEKYMKKSFLADLKNMLLSLSTEKIDKLKNTDTLNAKE